MIPVNLYDLLSLFGSVAEQMAIRKLLICIMLILAVPSLYHGADTLRDL
jgi:hypothetical protein